MKDESLLISSVPNINLLKAGSNFKVSRPSPTILDNINNSFAVNNPLLNSLADVEGEDRI